MIAVVSDVHGNLPALRTVLEAAQGLGCDRVVSLGDVVGYYAQPGQCIDLLRETGALHLMGNHDSYVVGGQGCPRSRLVSEISEHHRRIVTDEQRAWLAASPETHREGGAWFTHGGWRDHLEQYLYKVSEDDLPAGATRLFTGHTHVQTLFRFGARSYCNPGSVGQPRDGDPRAAFATLDGDAIALHRVAYDIDATAAAMRAAGYPPRTYENLYIGAQIGGRIDRVVRKETEP